MNPFYFLSSLLSSTMPITLFNPFTLKKDLEYSVIRIQIQEIIYYAESRFRSILYDLKRSEKDQLDWTQKLLHRELVRNLNIVSAIFLTKIKVFILSLIGTSSALGQAVDIPIILRTLAGTFALVVEDNLPLPFDADFLATLDTPAHDKCEVVKNYAHPWWTGRKPRDLNTVNILNASTLQFCLDLFKEQLVQQSAGTSTHNAGDFSNSRSGPGPSPGPGPGSSPGCRICHKYRQLLSDVLQDILKYQNFASVMSTSSQNLLNLGLRRASTFHLLYEAAIMKETAGLSPPAQAPTEHRISAVMSNASNELNRLKELPASSYKWTWGETLTKKEVLKLRQTGSLPGRAPHSGYEVSLKAGRLVGEYSDDPVTFTSSLEQYEDLPDDAGLIPPPSDFGFPAFFSQMDPRIHDPLHLSNDSISHYLPKPTSLFSTLAIKHPAHSRSGTGSRSHNASGTTPAPASPPAPSSFSSPASGIQAALNLADCWTSTSRSGSSTNNYKASASVSALQQAENWTSGSASGSDRNNNSVMASALEGQHLPDVIQVINVADKWTDDDGEDSGDKLPGPEQESNAPAGNTDTQALQVAEQWEDSDQGYVVSPPKPSLALCLADKWRDSDEHSGSEASPPEPSTALNLADAWRDSDEYSGHGAAPTGPSSALRLAEEWKDSDEDSGNESGPVTTDLNWSYGPEHFSFLREEMFVYSSDEDE